MRKRTCAECANNRFGLIRYYSGFNQFCTRLCKERFLKRREIERRDKSKFPAYLSRAPSCGRTRDCNSAPTAPWSHAIPRPATSAPLLVELFWT
jgi:hypothetical protein